MANSNHPVPVTTPNLIRFPGLWITQQVHSDPRVQNSRFTNISTHEQKLKNMFGHLFGRFLKTLEETAKPNVTTLAKSGALKMFHEQMRICDLFSALIEDLIQHYKTQYPEDTTIEQEWKDVLIAYAEHRYETNKLGDSPFLSFANKLLERLRIVEKESEEYKNIFETLSHLKPLLEDPTISDLLLCALHHPEVHVKDAATSIMSKNEQMTCEIHLPYSSLVQAFRIASARFQNDLELIEKSVVDELEEAKQSLSDGIKSWDIIASLNSPGYYNSICTTESKIKNKIQKLRQLVSDFNRLDFANLESIQPIPAELGVDLPQPTDQLLSDLNGIKTKIIKNKDPTIGSRKNGEKIQATPEEFESLIKAHKIMRKCHKLWDLFVVLRIQDLNRMITVINAHHAGIRTLFNNDEGDFNHYLERSLPFQLSYPDLEPPARTTTVSAPLPSTSTALSAPVEQIAPAPPTSTALSAPVEQITSGMEKLLRQPTKNNVAKIALRQTLWHLEQLNGFLKSDAHRSDHLCLWTVASHCAWAIEQALSYKLLSQGKPVPPGHNLRLRYDSFKPGERYFPEIIDQLYLFNHWSRFPLEGHAERNALSTILSKPRLPKLLLKMVQYSEGKDTTPPDLQKMLTNTCTLIHEAIDLSPQEVEEKSEITAPITIGEIKHAQVARIIEQLNATITTLPPDTRRACKLKQARSSLHLLNEILNNFTSATTPQQLNSSVVCTLNLLQHAISEILSYHLLSNGRVLDDKHEISVFAAQLGINTGDVGEIFQQFSQKGRYPVNCPAKGEAAKLVDECEVLCKSPPIEDGFTPVTSKVDSFGWKLQNAGITPEKIRERLEVVVSKSCEFLSQSLKK